MKRPSTSSHSVNILNLFLIGCFVLFQACAISPRITKPLEITTINNKLTLVLDDSSDQSIIRKNAKIAERFASIYYNAFKELGDSVIFSSNIIILNETRSCTDKVKNLQTPEDKFIVYGCKNVSKEVSRSIMKFSSKHLKNIKEKSNYIIFITENHSGTESFVSPNFNHSLLTFGGGLFIKSSGKNNQYSTDFLDKGVIKTKPNRGTIFARTNSISEVPSVIDLFQFLTRKYHQDLQYLMPSNKAFYRMVYDYNENKNYIVELENNQ